MQKQSLICIASHSLTGNKCDCCTHDDIVLLEEDQMGLFNNKTNTIAIGNN